MGDALGDGFTPAVGFGVGVRDGETLGEGVGVGKRLDVGAVSANAGAAARAARPVCPPSDADLP